MYRNDKYKLVMYPRANVVRLYDMETDPLETKDLAESDKRPVVLLKELFKAFQQQQQLMNDPLDVSDLLDNFLNNMRPIAMVTKSKNESSKHIQGH
jgi:choline-sulfatase